MAEEREVRTIKLTLLHFKQTTTVDPEALQEMPEVVKEDPIWVNQDRISFIAFETKMKFVHIRIDGLQLAVKETPEEILNVLYPKLPELF